MTIYFEVIQNIITTNEPPEKTEGQKIVFYKAQKWVFYN